MKTNLTALLVAILMSLNLTALGPGQLFTVAVTNTVSPLALPIGAPCSVRSYSTHARLQMAERDISEAQVRDAVTTSCRYDKVGWQWDGTYRYYGTIVVVVMDWRANVVTVHFNSGGGGGSWAAPLD